MKLLETNPVESMRFLSWFVCLFFFLVFSSKETVIISVKEAKARAMFHPLFSRTQKSWQFFRRNEDSCQIRMRVYLVRNRCNFKDVFCSFHLLEMRREMTQPHKHLKPLLHVETFSWNLCATAPQTSFTKWCYTVKLSFLSPLRSLRPLQKQKAVLLLVKLVSQQKFKKFHETDHVTRCNACWNMFRNAFAHKFQLKVSTCNSGLKLFLVLG